MLGGPNGDTVRRGWSAGIAVIIIASLMSSFGAPRAAAQNIDPNWSPPPTVYLPKTGQTLDRLFLDLWRGGGGAAAFGYPITPEITLPDGRIVQYLEYARFEYLPEGDDDGNYARLGAIGRELRPQMVPRTVTNAKVAGPKPGGASASQELAAMSRAWLPLDAAAAARPATDTWRFIAEAKHSVANGFKAFWEATGEASYLGNPLTEEYVLDRVTYQVFERGQLAWKQGKDPWMVAVGKVLAARYDLDMSPQGQGDIPTYSEELFVPPPAPEPAAVSGPAPPVSAGKAIVVSISEQRMWAYQDSEVQLTSLVSTGRPGFDTPTGLFYINVKVEVQDMEGLIGGEYYNVPEVPDVMYFTDVGHAFHGTYWHNNFGAVMSHGCINLPLDVASWLYDWTPSGTPVLIVP